MKKILLSAEKIAGLFIGLLGALVAVRWITQSASIGALVPGSAQMGINTPVLFMAAGFCCYTALSARGRWLERAWQGAAGLLLVLPAAVLAEHLFDVSLGIDFVRVPTAPSAQTPHPGRVAPNTCAAFLLAGIALQLLRAGRAGRLLAVCAGAVLAIGASALLGYLLKLEGLYRFAAANAMVAPTAAGVTVLGIGLWALRSAHRHGQAGSGAHDGERRITLRAIMVVALVALCAGAAGFTVVRDSYEQSVAQNMRLIADSSAISLGNTLDNSLWFPRSLAARPELADALLRLRRRPDDAQALASLGALAAAYRASGFSALAIRDAQGKPLLHSGSALRATARARQPLAGSAAAELLWNGGYTLYADHPVMLNGEVLGRVVSEQALPLFDRLLADIRASSDSSDILLCNLERDHAFCAPTRFYAEPFRIPMRRPDGSVNLPINQALLGQSGTRVTPDLRGIPVFAAYTPIRAFGLGVVVKNNVETLYAPLRAKANAFILALLALVVLGTSMLLIQVRPLLAQLGIL